ncbi:MAG: hypothetical protein GWN84_02765 [Gammaproteobacteria bacterium]|nr:hypothetical protein [Gammaproteobacteria bacterium]NIR82074.1 hypothetical protein [Gammaproteobacteria bacterium]NIR89302.1 hypothetical protein [Gammaproteobacteria bacterium]NIU03184.1 hypothetical protein [Gammaproteobacteria bacterium]NIV50700.1 hypothetical protein [Gammaproteobacteria bacterium]
MPEGDTVHKLADAIGRTLAGQVTARVTLRGETVPALAGRRVRAVFAQGKHLFIRFEEGMTLRSHLGMYGSWHRYASGEPWRKPQAQATLALWTPPEVLVCFNAREVELLRSGGIRERNTVRRLGPDLGGEGFCVDEVLRRAREFLEPETLLVDVLLDQRIAAGIGNVYKSEVLFVEKVHPTLPLEAAGDTVLRRLYTAAHDLIRANLGGGPRMTRRGNPPLWVYGRHGRPCLRCDESIRYARLGATMRSTYWCAGCQRSPAEPGADDSSRARFG